MGGGVVPEGWAVTVPSWKVRVSAGALAASAAVVRGRCWGVGDQGEAPGQHALVGVAFEQLAQPFQADPAFLESGGAAQGGGQGARFGGQAGAGFGEFFARVADGCCQALQPGAAALGQGGDGAAQAFAPVVEALGALVDERARVAEAARQPFEPGPAFGQAAGQAAQAPAFEVEQLGQQLGAHRHRQFGGGGGGGSAQVRGIVDQGGVGLVADRRNQRNDAGCGGAHHHFLVEGHQIFQRAAATRHDDQIGTRHRAAGGEAVEAGDRRRDLGRRLLALHRHRPEQDMAGEAVGEAVQDVANHRAGRRGDHPDHPG